MRRPQGWRFCFLSLIHIFSAQEEERLRISRELHDEAGQALTSLKISLDLIRVGQPEEQEALRSRLALSLIHI